MQTLEIPVTRPAPPALGRKAWVEQIMGMPISVHVRALEPSRPDIEAGVQRVFSHLRRADAVFSTWRGTSDLLRLQHGEADPGEVHPWIGEAVEECLEAEELTDGLFCAWRGLPGRRAAFDPTGLVKGWAVQAAAAHLDIVEDISYSIGAGGDIVVGSGRGVRNAPTWRIGIEDPGNRLRIVDVVSLNSGAVATSGAAARGAHVIDPRTGRAIRRAGSATVVGPDLSRADVWATAAWVDPTTARALMERRDPAYRLLLN